MRLIKLAIEGSNWVMAGSAIGFLMQREYIFSGLCVLYVWLDFGSAFKRKED
jgi:hypothetical protein